MYSIGSFSKLFMSASVISIIGIIIFYNISSTWAFKCYIVNSCFVDPDANLMARFNAFDPTKFVFFCNKMFKWDSNKFNENSFWNFLLNGWTTSLLSAIVGLPYLINNLYVILAAIPLIFQNIDLFLFYISIVSFVISFKPFGHGKFKIVKKNKIHGSKLF
jgi:hypothetical protein